MEEYFVVDDDLCLFDGTQVITENEGNPRGRIGHMLKILQPLDSEVPARGTLCGDFEMLDNEGCLVGLLTEAWEIGE